MNWSQVYDPLGRRVLSTIVASAGVTGLLAPLGRAFARAGWTQPFFGTMRPRLGVAQARAHPFTALVAR